MKKPDIAAHMLAALIAKEQAPPIDKPKRMLLAKQAVEWAEVLMEALVASNEKPAGTGK